MAFIGTVKVWKAEKGFGFIISEDGTELFAHIAAVADGKMPQQSDKVTFDIEESTLKPGNYQACNISGGSGGDASSGKGACKGGLNTSHVATGAFTGKVKSFVQGKGWGFIIGPDGSDIFVHAKAIVDGRDLSREDTVTFDLEPSKTEDGKMVAANVAGGTGWPQGQGKDGSKGGKGDSWGGKGDSWGDDGGSWNSGYGAAKGDGKGKDGPYGGGGGKGKMMEMMAGMMSAFMEGWGDDGWGGDGGKGKGGGKGGKW